MFKKWEPLTERVQSSSVWKIEQKIKRVQSKDLDKMSFECKLRRVKKLANDWIRHGADSNLKFVGFVVMVVQSLEKLALAWDCQVGGGVDSFRKSMTSVFLDLKRSIKIFAGSLIWSQKCQNISWLMCECSIYLDIKEFSEIGEPFDELRCSSSVKLKYCIRECFEIIFMKA